ncbi:MAG TPA: methyltransferase domain-containing protein [Pirellulales bacterium]|jgi:ubiquinone/menaquinone biosynthesis C-methylase UbiE|nr:methyltransferase domain-containing protein [Pirellulales bacterium]
MTTEYLAAQWGAVDRAADPRAFVRYLDSVSRLETIQRIKQRTYDLLAVQDGHCLLDVGCGTGDDVRSLAARVGRTGRVVGIDGSENMVAEAWTRAQGANLPVEFLVGDAERLEFPDDSFDGCRAERVLVHLNHPDRAFAEMVRVARPGARIVVFDADWETLVVDAPSRAITRTMLNCHCDGSGSRWIGRQLHRLFCEAGLTEITVTTDTLVFTDYSQADFVFQLREAAVQALAAGVVTQPQASQWLDDLAQANQRGTFFAAVTGFCVGGRKCGPFA